MPRFFFFQSEDGIRDIGVTVVQTCALPIFAQSVGVFCYELSTTSRAPRVCDSSLIVRSRKRRQIAQDSSSETPRSSESQIGRASCRERVEISVEYKSIK